MPRTSQFGVPDENFIARHQEIVKGMARRMARQFRVSNELEDVIRGWHHSLRNFLLLFGICGHGRWIDGPTG